MVRNNDPERPQRPKRPKSAYNLFFNHEKSRILQGRVDEPEPSLVELRRSVEEIILSSSQKAESDSQSLHWNEYRKVKEKWECIDKERKAVFEYYEGLEKERYRKEINQELLSASYSTPSSGGALVARGPNGAVPMVPRQPNKESADFKLAQYLQKHLEKAALLQQDGSSTASSIHNSTARSSHNGDSDGDQKYCAGTSDLRSELEDLKVAADVQKPRHDVLAVAEKKCADINLLQYVNQHKDKAQEQEQEMATLLQKEEATLLQEDDEAKLLARVLERSRMEYEDQEYQKYSKRQAGEYSASSSTDKGHASVNEGVAHPLQQREDIMLQETTAATFNALDSASDQDSKYARAWQTSEIESEHKQVAVDIQQRLDAERLEADQKEMVESAYGKSISAVQLVSALVENVKEKFPFLAGMLDIVAEDDMVFLAKRMLDMQHSFHFDEETPTFIDIGYHYTDPINLSAIRYNGLLTNSDKESLKIASIKYRRTSFGDGIYTANNPRAFTNFGATGVLVGRLQGKAIRVFGSFWNESTDANTIIGQKPFTVGHSQRMPNADGWPSDNTYDEVVLRNSAQCLPMIRYDTAILGQPQGIACIWHMHTSLQEIMNDLFNKGARKNRKSPPLMSHSLSKRPLPPFQAHTRWAQSGIANPNTTPMNPLMNHLMNPFGLQPSAGLPVAPPGYTKPPTAVVFPAAVSVGVNASTPSMTSNISGIHSKEDQIQIVNTRIKTRCDSSSLSFDDSSSSSKSSEEDGIIWDQIQNARDQHKRRVQEVGKLDIDGSSAASSSHNSTTSSSHIRDGTVDQKGCAGSSDLRSESEDLKVAADVQKPRHDVLSVAERKAIFDRNLLNVVQQQRERYKEQKRRMATGLQPSTGLPVAPSEYTNPATPVAFLAPSSGYTKPGTPALFPARGGCTIGSRRGKERTIGKTATAVFVGVNASITPSSVLGRSSLQRKRSPFRTTPTRNSYCPYYHPPNTSTPNSFMNPTQSSLKYEAPASLTTGLEQHALTTPSPSCDFSADCVICHDALSTNSCVAMKDCNHVFHKECILRAFKSKQQCPICRKNVGAPQGKSPSGTMGSSVSGIHCAGFNQVNTIQVTYHLRAGKQMDYHDGPGKPHSGKYARAFLPHNKDGQNLLKRLKYAFLHGLTFTVGTSMTTGRENQCTWSSIHHKTNLSGGVRSHGFPDPAYFTNCNTELDNLCVPPASTLDDNGAEV